MTPDEKSRLAGIDAAINTMPARHFLYGQERRTLARMLADDEILVYAIPIYADNLRYKSGLAAITDRRVILAVSGYLFGGWSEEFQHADIRAVQVKAGVLTSTLAIHAGYTIIACKTIAGRPSDARTFARVLSEYTVSNSHSNST